MKKEVVLAECTDGYLSRDTKYKNNYVYKITNNANGKMYIGSSSCDCEPKEHIGKRYFTSSRDWGFRKDFKANTGNYTRAIIANFKERSRAGNLEYTLLKSVNAGKSDMFYNMIVSKDGGWFPSAETLRKRSKAQSGINNHMYGKHHSEEHKDKMRALNTGSGNRMYGKKHTAETRAKMSISVKNRPKFQCPHCNAKPMVIGLFTRWHNDNCRHLESTDEY